MPPTLLDAPAGIVEARQRSADSVARHLAGDSNVRCELLECHPRIGDIPHATFRQCRTRLHSDGSDGANGPSVGGTFQCEQCVAERPEVIYFRILHDDHRVEGAAQHVGAGPAWRSAELSGHEPFDERCAPRQRDVQREGDDVRCVIRVLLASGSDHDRRRAV